MLLPATYEPGVQTAPANTQSMFLTTCKLGMVSVTGAVKPVVLVAATAGVVTQFPEQLTVAVFLYAVPYTIRLVATNEPPAVAVKVSVI